MLRYAVTITLSAFLLFQVQPLIARFVLPWFGGTPAVWTTCMLFFQVVLLGGYTYAHLIDRWLRPKTQAIVHTALLLLALVSLPIIPNEAWKPSGEEWPTGRILWLLLLTIGLPYGLLSTTGPLLQAWYSRTHQGRSPYRLFALSNTGSLLALMTYPFVVEPNLGLNLQAYIWSGGFGLFALLCIGCAWYAARPQPHAASVTAQAERLEPGNLETDIARSGADAGAPPESEAASNTPAPSLVDLFFWLGLSIFPSMLLLATTSQLSQEVAVVPFLWVLPLSLYLLTFIICFDSPRWYRREIFLPLAILFNVVAALSLAKGVQIAIWVQMIGYTGALFVNTMGCHGELARMKPHPKYLTLFYLMVSLGGALGGVFVVLAAPSIFTGYYELHLGLAACFAFTMAAYVRQDDWLTKRLPSWLKASLAGAAAGGLSIAFYYVAMERNPASVVEKSRDFYGTLTVVEYHNDEFGKYRRLRNGRIIHGTQILDPKYRLLRTSYYARNSGIGLAVRQHPRLQANPDEPMKIGVVGLGTGTLVAYTDPGDTIRFYEINPDVIRVAREQFHYLDDSPGEVELVLGDARVQMEREAEAGDLQQFDILAIDAFSSDAIPMHLLTRECFEVYFQHLKPDGILALHISNRYLDLAPVVYHLGREQGIERPVRVEFYPKKDEEAHEFDDISEWALLTHNAAFLDDPEVAQRLTPWDEDMQEVIWTDNYGSLWQVMRRFRWKDFGKLFRDD